MALTPTISRMHHSVSIGGLKFTPSNSPSQKNLGRRTACHDSGLVLRRVIGTTTASVCGFDCLRSTQSFAFTAGAGVVVVQLTDDGFSSQRFYRAKPTATSIAPSNSPYSASPGSFSHEARNRTVSSLRDAGVGYSPSLTSPIADWGESPSSKTWSARERIKAATATCFSPDGRFIAVGETGYRPRVLVFSLADDASQETPLTLLSEHTYGIRCLAFSPDSLYLASLGTVHDGFLYVWAINPRTGSARLHSSNKCISNVRAMAWIGNSLVTIGTRHVKVWRLEEPASTSPSKQRFAFEGTPPSNVANLSVKTLNGRNCLLGPMAEATFSCMLSISDEQAIVCSQKGDICLLDDRDGAQRFSKQAEAAFGINAVSLSTDGQFVLFGGIRGQTQSLALNEILSQKPRTPSPTMPISPESQSSQESSSPADILAMCLLEDRLVLIDSTRSIRVMNIEVSDGTLSPHLTSLEIPAHQDAVMGVGALSQSAESGSSFFTWCATGLVLFWNFDGMCTGRCEVDLEQNMYFDDDIPNELRVVRASSKADYLVSGDKYGVLRVIDFRTRKSIFATKAHGSEITDIAIMERQNTSLIASCAKDRMIQLFRKTQNSWELLQTLDEHTGVVAGICFLQDGNLLASCSSDRTVVVRELVSKNDEDGSQCPAFAYMALRILSLKATPISITSMDDASTNLIVSTADRQILRYDGRLGRLVQSFRTTDHEGNDSVIMDSLVASRPAGVKKQAILSGVAHADKSIRVYEVGSGTLLAKEYSHTEGVSDLTMVEVTSQNPEEPEKRKLISTGCDGTIMLWDYMPKAPHLQEAFDYLPKRGEDKSIKDATIMKPPLRRILSKSELAELRRASGSDFPPSASLRSPPRPAKKKSSLKQGSTSQQLSRKDATSPVPFVTSTAASPINTTDHLNRKGVGRERSLSPSSPPKARARSRTRRPSWDSRATAAKSKNTRVYNSDLSSSQNSSLNPTTEQLCRDLRAYRKKLSVSTENLSIENANELDLELRLTAQTLGDKASRLKGISDAVVAELLDHFSDRMLEMIDEKIAKRLATNAAVAAALQSPVDPLPDSPSISVHAVDDDEDESDSTGQDDPPSSPPVVILRSPARSDDSARI